VASNGETCDALATYTSTGLIAGQATGTGSVLTWEGEGPSRSPRPSGGTLNPTDTTITTTGTGAIGVVTNSGGVTNISGGRRQHRWPGRARPLRHGRGLDHRRERRSTFATQGNGAIGIYATLGGVVSATGGAVTIATAGGVSRFRR
jgi:hypothetical protein